MLPLTVPLTPAYPYPFPPPPTAKRANTLLLKHKLVELLPPEQGKIYWSLLCDLVTGKITREEFELGWRDHLDSLSHGLIDTHTGHNRVVDHDQLAYLHNALLLSILYNTTKPTLPPASVAHTGWTSKRKRGGIDAQGEGPGADPLGEYARKRRRLKRLVAGMTKGEKKRLRLLLNNRDKKGHDPMHLPPVMESIAEKTRLGLMPASAGLKTPNSGMHRSPFVPLCCWDVLTSFANHSRPSTRDPASASDSNMSRIWRVARSAINGRQNGRSGISNGTNRRRKLRSCRSGECRA
jgi:hypothetical protein